MNQTKDGCNVLGGSNIGNDLKGLIAFEHVNLLRLEYKKLPQNFVITEQCLTRIHQY